RAAPPAPAARNVYVAGGLSADDLTVLSVAVAAADPSAVLLLDSPKTSAHNRDFLAAFGPTEVVAVGSFSQGTEDLVKRLGIRQVAYLEWKGGPPISLWRRLFPDPQRVVVCPAGPRRLVLQAACLAGASKAPLVVLHGEENLGPNARAIPAGWKPREIIAVGAAADRLGQLPGDIRVTNLPHEDAVAAACLAANKETPPGTPQRTARGGRSGPPPPTASRERAACQAWPPTSPFARPRRCCSPTPRATTSRPSSPTPSRSRNWPAPTQSSWWAAWRRSRR